MVLGGKGMVVVVQGVLVDEVGNLFGLCDCESPGSPDFGPPTFSWLSMSRFVYELNPTHAGISRGRASEAPRDRRNEIHHNVDGTVVPFSRRRSSDRETSRLVTRGISQ